MICIKMYFLFYVIKFVIIGFVFVLSWKDVKWKEFIERFCFDFGILFKSLCLWIFFIFLVNIVGYYCLDIE